LLFYFVALVPFAVAFAWWYFGYSNYFPLPLMLGTCLLIALSLAYSTVETDRVRRALETTPLAQRIAGGEFIEDPIFDLTPAAWRHLLPGGAANPKTTEVIRRVAWNLDWYMGRPRPLRRFIWIYQPLAVCIGIFALVALLLPRLLGFQHQLYSLLPFFIWQLILDTRTNPKWATILLAAICLCSVAFIQYRRQIWTEELVRHLRERLLA
jgi:hypothetical protein